MLSQYRDKIRGGVEFFARIFLRLGFTPNRLTVFCLVLGLLASGFFAWNKDPRIFGVLILVIGMLDAVDGTLARMTNKCTKFGSYLDAMCDRVYEAAAILAAAYVSGYWVLAFLVLTASLLTSYAKARAAMEVQISNTEWPDLVERFERSLIFTGGIILWGFFPGDFFGHDLFFWTLVLLSTILYVSLTQRFLRAKKIIEARS